VGDINYTLAQRKRGGGTVAFQCEPLWSALSQVLEDKAPLTRVSPATPKAATDALAARDAPVALPAPAAPAAG
jgi:hypothetical protein